MSQPTIPRKSITDSTAHTYRPSQPLPPSESSQASSAQYPQYHDDPSDDQDHDQADEPPTLPPYSSPSTPSLAIAGPSQSQTPYQYDRATHYPGLLRLDYKLYACSHHDFTLSSDKTTLSSHSAILSKSASTLFPLLQALCSIPPKPTIRISGKGSNGIQDFDVLINCMDLICSDNEKARMNYIRVIGPDELAWRGEIKQTLTPNFGGLEKWVKRFCEDRSAIKQFVLERTVINWDTTYIQGRLLSLVASTNYRGYTTITFPVSHNKVVVHSPDKYNRFFSNVTKAFTGSKKYEVVTSVWPYADVARIDGNERGRKCVIQDEERWFSEWKNVIRYAVLAQKKGYIGREERLEELMEPKGDADGQIAPWGNN